MSIASQVVKAFRSMRDGDPEGALHDICSSIEATCKLIYGNGGKANYRRFIHENLAYITHFAFGGVAIENITVPYTHPELPRRPDGTCTIEDVLYHVVRCGMYHSAGLPSNIQFSDARFECRADGTLVLPSSLVSGLILSVIVNPVHAGVTTTSDVALTMDEFCNIPVDKLWGKRDELRRLWDALTPFR